MSPLARKLVRGTIAAAASFAITMLSLLLVAELNADPEPIAHAHALLTERAVPVAPTPEPEPLDEPILEPLDDAAPSTAPTPEASVDPPPPRPPAIAGVAGSTALGGMPLALASGGLPSVADLPSAELDAAVPGEPDTPARVTHRPAPEYPALAQRRGIEGFVTVRLRIDERGRVVDAVVVESEPPGTFDQTALRTVRRYRFSPARRGGASVSTTLQQTIRFELE